MMKPNSINLNLENIAKSSSVRVIDVAPRFEFKDGERTDNHTGTTFTLIAENNAFEKFKISTSDTKDVVTKEQIEQGTPIFLSFEGFVGKFYWNTRLNDWALSCKAEKAMVVKPATKTNA